MLPFMEAELLLRLLLNAPMSLDNCLYVFPPVVPNFLTSASSKAYCFLNSGNFVRTSSFPIVMPCKRFVKEPCCPEISWL